MKKIIIVIAALFAGISAFAEEKNITTFFGGGATVPVYRIKVENDGSRLVTGALADFSLFHINRSSGLTMKIGLGMGWGTTSDIPLYDKDRKHCFMNDFQCSVGYAFANTENTVFSLGALLGVASYDFSGSEKIEYEGKTLSHSNVSGVNLELGLEAVFVKRLTEKMHFFANVDAAYLFGSETNSYSKEFDDIDYEISFTRETEGYFSVSPTIGIYWQF